MTHTPSPVVPPRPLTVGMLRAALQGLPPNTEVAIRFPPSRASSEDEPLGGHWCAHLDVLQSLVVLRPAELRSVDRMLFESVERNDLPGCEAALEAGADASARDVRSPFFDGQSPLHLAIGSPSVLAFLLSKGADPNVISTSGWTPLMRACNAGLEDAARILLAAGADPHAVNDEGYTARGRVPGNIPSLLALMTSAEAK